MKISFRLNKKAVEIEADADETLADVLRREFKVLSLRESRIQGMYGECTVLLNDNPVPACMIPIFTVIEKDIITLEFFSETQECTDILSALKKYGMTLCGFCSAGTLLTAHSIINQYRNPTAEHIRTAYAGIMCRCLDIVAITAALQEICRSKRSKRHAQ